MNCLFVGVYRRSKCYDVVNFCVQIDGRPWLQRSDEDVSLISSRELCVVDDALLRLSDNIYCQLLLFF